MDDDFSSIFLKNYIMQQHEKTFLYRDLITNEAMEGVGDIPLPWGEYPDNIEPDSRQADFYDLSRSKYVPLPDDVMDAKTIKAIQSLPENSQIDDPIWIGASRIVHEYFNSEDNDVEMTPDDYSNYGIRIMSAFNNNITAMVIDANKLSDAPAPVAKAFYYLMETSDREGITLANAGRGIINMVKDPTTWVGLGTLGIGVAGKYAGKRLTKMGVKELLKGIVLSKPTSASLAVGAEGAIYSAADNYARQTAKVAAEQQEGYNLKELATSGAVGAVVGERLGAGAPNVLEAGRRSIVKLGESAKKRLTEPGETLRSGFDIDPALAKLGDIADIKAPTDKESGIIAFHGSGSDFNKFSLNKIGTGEGAQAFGYGLYFTDSEDIAKFYKNALSDDMTADTRYLFKGQEYERGSPEWKMLATIYNDGFSSAKRLLKTFKSDLEKGEPYITPDEVKRYEAIFNQTPKKSQIGKKQGRIYKVGLAPKPDELLDYDLPLGQQNKFIKQRLSKVANEMTVDDAINLGFDPFDFGKNDKAAINAAKKEMLKDDQSVVAFLNNWAVFRGEQGTAEKLLDKYGIKGIKYKANQGVGARNVPETGKSNYVIFDENLINILAKYGIVGPVAVTALKTQSQSDGEKDGNS